MRIGITYNLKRDPPPQRENFDDQDEEFDLPETIEAIQNVLKIEGFEVFPLGGDLKVIDQIKELQIDFVFNIAEGFGGRSREAHIPSLLEMIKIPYSGSDPLGLAVTLEKGITKRIAASLAIPTPSFWVLEGMEDLSKVPQHFPSFVKPLWQGSSKGIRRTSRVENSEDLEREVERLFENYAGDGVMVEEYVEGREFTVGVVGNKSPEVIGIMEIAFRDPRQKDFCYSLEVKRNWKDEVEYHVPPRLDRRVEAAICKSAVQLFRTLKLRDVARFDFRMDPKGLFYFLEVNPLPGLSPESGDLVILAQKKGWSYRDLILKITQSAFSRYPELNAKLNAR